MLRYYPERHADRIFLTDSQMVVIGAVYGSNSIPVCVAALEQLMTNCAKLLGKPKILIIQACQGQTQQDGMYD
jgi:hypothetical protein